jgi:hypothetical protein
MKIMQESKTQDERNPNEETWRKNEVVGCRAVLDISSGATDEAPDRYCVCVEESTEN